jgi:MutS domain V
MKEEDITTVFKLPIQFNDKKKEVSETLLQELEMIHSSIDSDEIPIYEKISCARSHISKQILKPFARTYTTDVMFLKDMQTFVKNNHLKVKNLDEIWSFWKENKNEKDFKTKYSYVDWKIIEWLNDSETFLLCVSLFNISSPLISLMLPLIGLLIPFFIIQVQGVEITFEKYLEILFEISEGNAVYKLITNFSKCPVEDKIYLVVSAAFYVFSIYQNFVICLKFCRNLMKINNELILMKQYIEETIEEMDAMLEITKEFKTFSDFDFSLRNNCETLKLLSKSLECVSEFNFNHYKLGELGYIMKVFYALYENKETVSCLLYSFGFNGFLEILVGLKENIDVSKLHACEFVKKKKKKKSHAQMEDMYYAGLIQNDSIVTNTISFDKNFILTGPNASGKTTLLKATLLNIIFSQQFGYGCYKHYQCDPYHHFHCYLNIIDNSGRDSLFQLESKKCVSIIECLEQYPKEKHFCVFDELFSGTNPIEAVNCGYGYLSYLAKLQNVDFLLTTHYLDLCKKLESQPRIQMHCMDVEKPSTNLIYTYKLKPGYNTINGGIEVLKQLNFPEEILQTIEQQ